MLRVFSLEPSKQLIQSNRFSIADLDIDYLIIAFSSVLILSAFLWCFWITSSFNLSWSNNLSSKISPISLWKIRIWCLLFKCKWNSDAVRLSLYWVCVYSHLGWLPISIIVYHWSLFWVRIHSFWLFYFLMRFWNASFVFAIFKKPLCYIFYFHKIVQGLLSDLPFFWWCHEHTSNSFFQASFIRQVSA